MDLAIGLSAILCEWPCHIYVLDCSGGTDSLQGFAQMLAIGVDGLIDVPHDRWDSAEYYDPDATTGALVVSKHESKTASSSSLSSSS
eukprot:4105438-Amphidinium_carterae.1